MNANLIELTRAPLVQLFKPSVPMSTESGASWIETSSDKSPCAFFQAFDIYIKQHGHQRYTQAVQESKLDQDIKSDLLKKFVHWKTNDGTQFWLDRQSTSSQIRTATVLVKGSESYAKDSIRRTEKKITGEYMNALMTMIMKVQNVSCFSLPPFCGHW